MVETKESNRSFNQIKPWSETMRKREETKKTVAIWINLRYETVATALAQ